MPTHSNVLTCFEKFTDDVTGFTFQMTETFNGNSLLHFIETQKVDLAKQITKSYREFVYDVAIQVANGIREAHSNGLVHGNLDISKVVL